MQVVLFDHGEWRRNFYPLSLTRPVSNLRTGILTLDEKWSHRLKAPVSFHTAAHLQSLFGFNAALDDICLIRGNILACAQSAALVKQLSTGEMLEDAQGLWAGRISRRDMDAALQGTYPWKRLRNGFQPDCIHYPEDLFIKNGAEIEKDFQLLTSGRVSAPLSSTNQILGDRWFAEEGVSVECATINTLKGPVYLGKNSQIFEGSNIRGPFALGEGSIVKMGTQIYSNVSIGPHSTIGGELNTCVVWGYSAKGHSGYFGSGVMGAWCNWGAGSSNSNLKNTYGPVRMFDYSRRGMRDTGRQVCGLIMGDFVRCAIHTAFYTGSVVGIAVHLAGSTPVSNFVPDFSWCTGSGREIYRLDELFETLQLVFQRRNRIFGESEQKMLKDAFGLTEEYRQI